MEENLRAYIDAAKENCRKDLALVLEQTELAEKKADATQSRNDLVL